MKTTFRSYIPIIIPLLLGLLALSIPLLRDFHVESAILVSVVGCFWAGWKASDTSVTKGQDVRTAFGILGYLYLFGIPLLAYTLLTGCFSVHGLGFWLLYPIPSVFFGYATGRLCRIWNVPYGRAVTVTVLLVIAVGVFLVESLSFPQVYFFNHVWGGWPGPIYDETVQLTDSLLFFRGLTVLWIPLLWFLPSVTRDKLSRWIFWLAAAALILGYTQLTEMEVISPESYLQQQLAGTLETAHFEIYYDRRRYTDDEIRLIALEHEFYLDEIAKELELDKPDSTHKIQSYLYAHPWQKKELTGAKFTSYVPVWLEQDQLHIAKQQLPFSLKHELVHVLSKQFGNWLFNASWSIGLIEGIAVALAPDESATSTIDQIVASEKPYPLVEEVQQALSPLGFYGGRSTVNYTTSGSFVRYLLREYPADYFKQAYRTGNVESAYPVSMQRLVQGWHQQLNQTVIDSVDRRIARRLFSIPSLFEQKCPHILSPFAQAWDEYEYYMAEEDTVQALQKLDDAMKYSSGNEGVKAQWAYQNLKAGNIEKVQRKANVGDSSADLQMLYADAFALGEEQQLAEKHLNEAAGQLNQEPVETLEAALATRVDGKQWRYYRHLTYRQKFFPPDTFSELYYRTQIRAVEQVIRTEEKELLMTYARQLLNQPADLMYFDQYITMIHWLGYYGGRELAESWLTKLSSMQLRERHKERLEQEQRWIRYVNENS